MRSPTEIETRLNTETLHGTPNKFGLERILMLQWVLSDPEPEDQRKGEQRRKSLNERYPPQRNKRRSGKDRRGAEPAEIEESKQNLHGYGSAIWGLEAKINELIRRTDWIIDELRRRK